MKHSAKNKKRPEQQTAPAASSSSRRLVVLGACLVLAAGATWAVMEFVVWNKLPSQLVGQWEVVEGPPGYKEAEFEFSRGGKMKGHWSDNGMERVVKGDVRVEGDKLYITTQRPTTGEERVSVQTIRTLTDREFIVADEKGQVMKMRRMP